MNLIKRLTYAFLIGFILLVALLSFMLNSTSGVYTTLFVAKRVLPGKLEYHQVKGSLISPLKIGQLCYEDSEQILTIQQLRLKWRPFFLFRKEVRISHLSAEKIALTVKSTEKDEVAEPLNWPHLPLDIRISQLRIQKFVLNDTEFHNVTMQAFLNNQSWQLHNLALQYQDTGLHAQGAIDPRPPHAASLRVTARSLEKAGIPVQAELSLSGDSRLYWWKAQLQKPFDASLQGSLQNLQQIQNTMEWSSIKYALNPQQTLHLTQGHMNLYGEYPNFHFSASAKQMSPFASSLSLSGSTNLKTLQIQGKLKSKGGSLQFLTEAGFAGNRYVKMSLNGENIDLQSFKIPLRIQTLNGSFSASDKTPIQADLRLQGQYDHTDIQAEGHLRNQQISASVKQQNNTLQISGSWPFPLHITLDLPEPSTLSPALKGLKTRIQGNIDLRANQRANATIRIAGGQWLNPDAELTQALNFRGGEITANLNGRRLQAQGDITIDSNKTLQLNLELPDFSLNTPNKPTQPVQGKFTLNVNELGFLAAISPAIATASGNIQATLQLDGTLGKPSFKGNIQLNKGSFGLSNMGIVLNPVNLTLDSSLNQWKLNGSIGSPSAPLQIQGSGTFAPEIKGNIRLQAREFLLMNTNEYVIYISPDLNIQLARNDIVITGSIVVPKGEIKPQTFDSTVNLTSDVVFAEDKKKAQESGSLIKTNISVRMGDNVKLNIKGLTARVVGGIQIQNESSGPFNASGQLSVVDGKYTAYGQDLTIAQGELLFSGGQIINPGINVRAVRTFSNASMSFSGSNRLLDFSSTNLQAMNFATQTTVGIQISGRLDSPKISLFSQPGNLSQADILSMLLLGRPASQASSAGGQLLLSAITSMNLGGGTKGTQLLSQLQSALGLDFNLQDNATYDQQSNTVSEKQSLAVSKSLSQRLSVSYNMGISDLNSNGITLKYLLNRFFNIQVTASTDGSGIDFVYTYHQD